MNSYQTSIQDTIARLGDHLGRMQLLMRNLAECRNLTERQLDPETELALVCWLQEAADLMGSRPERLHDERPLI